MTKGQKALWTKRIRELLKLANDLEALKLSNEWVELFTTIGFYRGWISINKLQKSQIKNIATINSEAVLYLSQKGKIVGLSLLEKLSTEIHEEDKRLYAVNLIIKYGVKESKKDLEILFNQKITEKTLLDFM
jgi:hypothetical protein